MTAATAAGAACSCRSRTPAAASHRSLAELSADGHDTLLTARADSLDFMASVLAGHGCDFEVRRPEEPRDSVRALAARLVEAVDFAAGESRA